MILLPPRSTLIPYPTLFRSLGLPITWYAARALGERHPAAVALAVVIVISAAAGFTKAEVERIWLMFVPLACVAAAARSEEHTSELQSRQYIVCRLLLEKKKV